MFISKDEKQVILDIFKIQTKTAKHMINRLNDLTNTVEYLEGLVDELCVDLTSLEQQLAILQRDTKRAKAKK